MHFLLTSSSSRSPLSEAWNLHLIESPSFFVNASLLEEINIFSLVLAWSGDLKCVVKCMIAANGSNKLLSCTLNCATHARELFREAIKN